MFYTYVDAPIGPFLLAGDGSSLSKTSFTTGTQHRRPEADWILDPAPLSFAVEQVEEYFAGDRIRKGPCFSQELSAGRIPDPLGRPGERGRGSDARTLLRD